MEMLCASYGVSHSINLFIVGMLMRLPFCVIDVHFGTDANMWILYADRQGCIQSHGFNFIQDLPTFFVLLLALQRLDLARWGLNPGLDARVRRAHQGLLVPNNEEGRTREPNEWKINMNGVPVMLNREKWHSTLTMTGRGTVIAAGRNDGQLLAVKMYWPEAHRPKEHMLIHDARVAGRGDSDIINHLPTVFAWQDFEDTSPIRYAVGLEAGKPRRLRVIALQYLDPITTLSKEEFVRAWLDCVRCRCH
jgi:hypothetical protein